MENLHLHSKKRTLLLATLVTLIMILSVSSSVFADTVGPAFSEVYPARDAVLSSGKITVSLTARDADTVNASSLIMRVDGGQVRPITAYGWIDEWTDDYTILSIYYPTTFSNGSHTIEVSVKDGVGNTSTYTTSFTVGQAPKITSMTPANGAVVSDRRPLISAVISPSSAVNQSSVVMTVDGGSVPVTFDAAAGKASYVPASDLVNEKLYNVTLTARDTAGNQAAAQWQFTLNTYGDMTFSADDNTCQKCHLRTDHLMNNCAKCHGTNLDANKPVYPLDDCYNCHFNSSYPTVYHLNGLPVSIPPDHPARTTDSCVVCHGKTWSTGIPLYHSVSSLADRHNTTSTGCENCHAKSLTREHARRKDSSGAGLTCSTCHNSTDTRVRTAVNTGNSACSACHTLDSTGGHPAHTSGLDSSCQTCHSDTILGEQQFHQKNGCEICHGAGAADLVKYSVNTKNTSCFSCHEQGHNVNFVQKVPSDIPLYPGYTWSLPTDARIWVGEPWFSSEYSTAGAKIVISGRRQSVSGTEVYNWYQQNLTTNGWVKTAGSLQGSDNFSTTYTKANRLVTVNFYGGETHDQTSPFIGYRMEVLYK